MAKCYYCGGAGCSQCRKMTKSSYGADAVAKAPSPNGEKIPVTKVKELDLSTDSYKFGRKVSSKEYRSIFEEIEAKVRADQKKIKYAWYSKKAARQNGTVIYRRPDGSEVEVSSVSDDPTKHGLGWDDVEYIGEVTEFVRRSR